MRISSGPRDTTWMLPLPSCWSPAADPSRDVEGDVELQDQVAEAALGPDELAHDGAQHAEHDRDVEAREHERQGVRERDEPERLPPAGPERAHQFDLRRVDRLEADD